MHRLQSTRSSATCVCFRFRFAFRSLANNVKVFQHWDLWDFLLAWRLDPKLFLIVGRSRHAIFSVSHGSLSEKFFLFAFLRYQNESRSWEQLAAPWNCWMCHRQLRNVYLCVDVINFRRSNITRPPFLPGESSASDDFAVLVFTLEDEKIICALSKRFADLLFNFRVGSQGREENLNIELVIDQLVNIRHVRERPTVRVRNNSARLAVTFDSTGRGKLRSLRRNNKRPEEPSRSLQHINQFEFEPFNLDHQYWMNRND